MTEKDRPEKTTLAPCPSCCRSALGACFAGDIGGDSGCDIGDIFDIGDAAREQACSARGGMRGVDTSCASHGDGEREATRWGHRRPIVGVLTVKCGVGGGVRPGRWGRLGAKCAGCPRNISDDGERRAGANGIAPARGEARKAANECSSAAPGCGGCPP